ncbi:hypothetical protein EAI_02370, partial [Harpegnathos saltator]
ILVSLTLATLKQYTRSLRSWWDFCRQHEISPFSPDISLFLKFLFLGLLHVGFFFILKKTRSAISLISTKKIEDHTLVKRFCKGASFVKLQRPHYDFIWDPAPAISHLATIFPYDSVPLNKVTMKLILLLALGSGQRTQTIASIKILQIQFSQDKFFISIPDRIKTLAPGRLLSLLMFSRFSNRPSLCITLLLKHYLNITSDLRSSLCDALLISCKKPHQPVSVQTVSHWIRQGLEFYGVQTTLFSAYSTRHASTSLAAKNGVSIDLIKRAAGWSGDSRVFANFY